MAWTARERADWATKTEAAAPVMERQSATATR